MKKGSIRLVIGLALLMAGCKDISRDPSAVEEKFKHKEELDIAKNAKLEAEHELISIFPASGDSFIGDPMPYFDGEKMNLFYLEDQRLGTQGYHPWARCTTTDFCSYEFLGEVIPYGEDITKQDIALGTGSVIKDKKGIYHAFYTGHNDTYTPKEAIMHATSTNLQDWVKQEQDTFYAAEEYAPDDFRDPYVFYQEEDGRYWMLITTRKNNMGVIALYKSTDLVQWSNEKVLFTNDMGTDSNLECPTLIEWKGYWYLSFSDQWPDRRVHYRIAKSPGGLFEKPQTDVLDGNGFYAGRLEKMDSKMYLIGWNATKDGHQDENNYNWGGNLVSHEVIQKEDGLLGIIPVQSIANRLNQKIEAKVVSKSETITLKDGTLHFSGADYEVAAYPALEGCTKITGEIELEDKTGSFGFAFNLGESKFGTLNYVFQQQEGCIGFFNKRTDTISSEEAQSKVNYPLKKGDKINFTILFDHTVAVLYVNDEIALTARMYSANKREWGFFGEGSKVSLRNVQTYN